MAKTENDSKEAAVFAALSSGTDLTVGGAFGCIVEVVLQATHHAVPGISLFQAIAIGASVGVVLKRTYKAATTRSAVQRRARGIRRAIEAELSDGDAKRELLRRLERRSQDFRLGGSDNAMFDRDLIELFAEYRSVADASTMESAAEDGILDNTGFD
jgi:hypothetical protein